MGSRVDEDWLERARVGRVGRVARVARGDRAGW
jgi:hypothetical protein